MTEERQLVWCLHCDAWLTWGQARTAKGGDFRECPYCGAGELDLLPVEILVDGEPAGNAVTVPGQGWLVIEQNETT